MKKIFLFLSFSFAIGLYANGQSVGIGTTTPNSSAKLDVSASNQGFLPPRMTYTQRNAIVSPAAGLIIYCTTCGTNGELQVYTGSGWMSMIQGTATDSIRNPTITTTSATSITYSSATCGGNISNGGGLAVIQRGVVWNTVTAPTIALTTKTNDGSSTGAFTSNITGLLSNTRYYVRAYVTNSQGTFYGNEINFTTAPYALVTDTSGNSYPVINICSQIWMGKNLNVSRYRNGDIIPKVTDSAEWRNLTTGAWCWYRNDSATYASTYGKLYNWYAVNDPRGLAPNGWHIPSDPEWANLSSCIDSNTDTTFNFNQNSLMSIKAGKALKETDTLRWKSPNFATNSSRFTALPGGGRSWSGGWLANKTQGIFWSRTNIADQTLLNPRSTIIFLRNNDSAVYQFSQDQKSGFSVRCIKGDPPTVFLPTITTTPISSLGFTSCSSGGTNITNGGATIFAKGVVWSTSPNPTINLTTLTNEGAGTTTFTSNITSLESNTTYYIRAYATTSAGTGYGNEITFTTPICPASNNTNISALAGSYNNTNEDFGGSLYGPYATTVSSFSTTSTTTGTITVTNIYDYGWAPITFKLDWTDPANPTVTLDQQDNIAGGSTLGLDDTYQVTVRAFAGENGTYSVCSQTIQLKMQLGVKDASGVEQWSPSLYIVNMAR